MKRHERRYGCTFLTCNKDFRSKNDLKRHENSRHLHLETWRCDEERPEGGACAKVCYQKQTFQEHLSKEHEISDADAVKDKVENCRIGRNCQARFWCGFCAKLVEVKKKGLEARTERFDHIDDHLMGRHNWPEQGIQDWIPADSDKPKGDIRSDVPVEKESSDDGNTSETHETLHWDSSIGGGDAIFLGAGRGKSRDAVETAVYCCQCGIGHNPNYHLICTNCNNAHEFCQYCKRENHHIEGGMGISEATSYSKFKHSTNDEMQRPDVAVEGFDIAPRAIAKKKHVPPSQIKDSEPEKREGGKKHVITKEEEVASISESIKSRGVNEHVMTKQEEGLSARGLSKTFNPQESEADIAATNTRKDKNNTSANFLASGSTAQVASSDSIAVDSFSVCREYPPGTMWTLYDNCSRAFLMTVKAAKGQEGVLNIKSSKMLASCSESLFLWGEGFESSDFDLLTQWSNDLNDAIIQYFLDISRCIIKDLFPLLSDSVHEAAIHARVAGLWILITDVAGQDLTNDIQSMTGGEGDDEGLVGQKIDDENKSIEEDDEDGEAVNESVVGQDFDDENECNEENDEVPDFIRDIETSCQCLMDLVPSIEKVVQQMRQEPVGE